jgi:hypothetical protein
MTFRNPLIPKRLGALAVLAQALLCLGTQGCLLPQDDVVFPDLPPKKNSPLRIVSQQPPMREVSLKVGALSTTCPANEFSVIVKDEDLGDTTRSLWFIDRTMDTPPVAQTGYVPGGSVQRVVTAPAALVSQLSALVDGQRHNVEVFVTDGEFSDTVGQATYPAGGYLPDGGLRDVAYVDSYLWLVEVQRCP